MTWLPQVDPQAADEALAEPADPNITEAAQARGITSIVHFTRTTGFKGIVHSHAVRARRDLPENQQIKYVYEENAADRSRDFVWHGYINLSVTAISRRMFAFSKQKHPDDEWVILHFGPEILSDPGVVFCTTNNVYEDVIHRARGIGGFEQMFAQRVPWGHYGSAHGRGARSDNETTCPQAEVLYPFELRLDHLHAVTVGDDDTYETVEAILSHVTYNPEIVLHPEAFR
jgi:hypothetical protein